MIRTQLTLYLRNEAGELARAIRAFARAKINIEGVSIAGSTDVSLVQLVVSNARAARQLLKKARIPVAEQKVAVLALPDRPGALADVANRLAKAGVNINYLYGTTARRGSDCESAVVISAEDLKKVEALSR